MEIPKEYRIKNQIWFDPEMFYSEAWQSMKKSASLINTLLRCFQKRKWEYTKINKKRVRIYTNDGFTFPYAEAKALNIAKNTQHWKNLRKLVEIGFLDPVHQGGWYRKHEKKNDYSVYKFSDRWRKYNTPEFEKVEMPRVLPKHFHIRENIKRQKSKVTSLKRRRDLHRSEDDSAILENNRLHANEDDKAIIKGCQSLTAIA
jgi:hypothetical protein